MRRRAISVAIVAGASRDRVAANIAATATQLGETDEILVLDLTPEAPLALVEDHRIHRVLAEGSSFGAARAIAARRAAGEVVAFVEDHCSPLPGWLEAVATGYGDDVAAVGYSFCEDPGDRWAGRATLLAEYGEWIEGSPDGATSTLPGNNVSYDVATLRELDGGDRRLDRYLSIDAILHNELNRRELAMIVVPAARVRHESLPSIGASMSANASYSRLLAAIQVELEGWGLARRLFYACAAPLGAPALRIRRLLGRLGARELLRPARVSLAPGVLAIYIAAALGQSLGYLRGRGDAAARLDHWELGAERT